MQRNKAYLVKVKVNERERERERGREGGKGDYISIAHMLNCFIRGNSY